MESTLIADIQQKAYLNIPYVFSDICIIYPLTLKEIVSMGQVYYSSYLSILTMDEFDIIRNAEKKGITIKPEQIDVFRFLIDSANQNYSFLLELKKAFRTFIREEILVLFDEYIIVIGDGTDKRFLTKENFSEFQNIIRVQNKRTVKEEAPPDESPIRKKMRLRGAYRDAVKRQQKSNDPDAADFGALMSVLACYTNKSPEQIKNYTFFAFKEDIERYQMHEKYDIDIRAILAGADSKKIKPEPWTKKINN